VVDEQLAPQGLRLTGNFSQLNASPAFSLIRLETDDSAVWFKATGEPNRNELPVAACLARLFPRYVPRFSGSSRPGWMAQRGNFRDEARSYRGVSFLVESSGSACAIANSVDRKTSRTLEGQCKDLRLPTLAAQIDPFLERMREFMAAQEKREPAPLTDTELTRLGTRLKQVCSSLLEAGLSDTLGHLDFNPGNIFVAPTAAFSRLVRGLSHKSTHHF